MKKALSVLLLSLLIGATIACGQSSNYYYSQPVRRQPVIVVGGSSGCSYYTKSRATTKMKSNGSVTVKSKSKTTSSC